MVVVVAAMHDKSISSPTTATISFTSLNYLHWRGFNNFGSPAEIAYIYPPPPTQNNINNYINSFKHGNSIKMHHNVVYSPSLFSPIEFCVVWKGDTMIIIIKSTIITVKRDAVLILIDRKSHIWTK